MYDIKPIQVIVVGERGTATLPSLRACHNMLIVRGLDWHNMPDIGRVVKIKTSDGGSASIFMRMEDEIVISKTFTVKERDAA